MSANAILYVSVIVAVSVIASPACSALTAPPGEDPAALTPPPAPKPPPTNLITNLIPPTQTEKVLVRRILVAYKGADGAADSVTRSEAAAKQLAASIRKKLVDNTSDFAGLAQMHSDAPEAHEGGLLPAFDRSATLEPALIQAAFNTPVQQISEVFATPQGYTVLQRLD